MATAGAAQAGDMDLCPALKSAWTAAKADPASVRDVRFPGSDRCSFSDSDLRCFWIFDSPEEAHRRDEDFRSLATACLAPLGLSPVRKVLNGVETTMPEPAAGEDPNVDLFYPPATPSSASASSRRSDPPV